METSRNVVKLRLTMLSGGELAICLQDRRVTLARYEPHATAICGAINKRINAVPLQTTRPRRRFSTSRGFDRLFYLDLHAASNKHRPTYSS